MQQNFIKNGINGNLRLGELFITGFLTKFCVPCPSCPWNPLEQHRFVIYT